MPTSSDVLSARQAAEFLGAHVETLRRLARRGAIPSFKIGKDWRFRKEALLRWAEEHHQLRSAGGPGPVLIIDDDEKVCRAMARVIQSLGYRVRTATSGVAGLARVSEETPGLILLDLKMPGMHGPEVLRKLRETHPDLPVVIVTGYPDSDLMKEASQYPPVLLLPKPAEPAQIKRTLRLALGDRLAARRSG